MRLRRGLLTRTVMGPFMTGNSTDAHTYYNADGNGNVTGFLNSKQPVVGRYLYDSYGNTLSLSGPQAEANPYRFSSKEYHANAGLYYYGYRFYEPSLQRWLNRDPIGEQTGLNLYRAFENDPIAKIDPIGLFNFVKAGVCAVNVMFGANDIITGLPLVTSGLALVTVGPIFGPVTPIEEAFATVDTAVGLRKVVRGVFKIKRGSQQCREAAKDPCKGHWVNLLGVLPFGSTYDDPGETSQTWDKIKNMPTSQKIGELLTF